MGVTLSFLLQNYWASTEWSVDRTPDLTGMVAIVTGATGIGKETARVLLQHKAKVYIASRTRSKSQRSIQELKQDTGKEAIYIELDLGSLKSVKAAAEEFIRQESQLHILFNNAGIVYPPVSQLTADGFDAQFGTNVIGHFYFTKLLLPTLIATASSAPTKTVRVVNTSSFGHHYHPSLNFNTFKDSAPRRKMSTYALYFQSKFGNAVFSNELARRYGDKGIVSTAVHPGCIDSEFSRHQPRFLHWIVAPGLYSVEKGALTQLRAGTDPGGVNWNGKYLIPWGRLGKADEATDDEALGRQLWEYMEEQVEDI